MTDDRTGLFNEIKQIDINFGFVDENKLIALVGSGIITLTLYRRLSRLLKASRELVKLAIEEIENEPG